MSQIRARELALADLAVNGGRPVRTRLLSYGHQVVDQTDVDAVVQVLTSNWLTTGPTVPRFERAFADFVGARHAVALSSGTAALHAASFAAGVAPGAEAIVPALTFVASANCTLYQGGHVVFADVRSDTLAIDPADVRAKVTPRTRAILAVDYGGQPADLSELQNLAREHRLLLIEDASHAVGAAYRDRRVGSVADLTTFSLHPVKQMTTGEGGIVTTDDDELANRVRTFRNHGIASDAREREAIGAWYYEMVALGHNYRLTDFQCALGLSQLDRLPAWLIRREEIARRYLEAFSALPGIVPLAVLPDRRSAWHLFVVRLERGRFYASRGELFAALRTENIGVNVHYIPVPWHPYYQSLGYRKGCWPVSEKAYEQIVTLPLWAGMTDADVDNVIAAVTKVHTAYAA